MMRLVTGESRSASMETIGEKQLPNQFRLAGFPQLSAKSFQAFARSFPALLNLDILSNGIDTKVRAIWRKFTHLTKRGPNIVVG